MSNVLEMSAYDIAKAIRERKVRSVHAVSSFIEQIKKFNSKIHAVVNINEQAALLRAHQADDDLSRGVNWGPLHGVPITVKDAWKTKDVKTTCNYSELKDHVPQEDAIVVKKLLNAGAIIIGKTNVPELLNDIQGIGPLFPLPNNPWNVNYTCGGSTCGAAGVSALFSPLEIGSSFNGSSEVPANYCGLFAYKPSLALFSMKGHIPPLLDQNPIPFDMTSPGFIGRSIDDFKLILDLFTSKRETEDPSVMPVPMNKGYAAKKNVNADFKIAWSKMPQYPLEKAVATTFSEIVELLSGEGFKLSEKNLPYVDNTVESKQTLDDLYQLAGEIFMESHLLGGASLLFRTATRLSGFWSSNNWQKGMGNGAAADVFALGVAQAKKLSHMAVMEKFLDDYDALLCPVSFTPPPKHSKPGTPVDIIDQKGEKHSLDYYASSIGITSIMNLAGLPTLVLPVGQTPSENTDGSPRDVLPIGVMIVTKRWHDAELLHVGEAITKALGLKVLTPPGFGSE